jgi:hypothetical protein
MQPKHPLVEGRCKTMPRASTKPAKTPPKGDKDQLGKTTGRSVKSRQKRRKTDPKGEKVRVVRTLFYIRL